VEVLDAQVHLNHIHPERKTAQIDDILAAALAAMDAVGVDGLVVSEFWGFDGRWREELPNGVFRSRYPFSELAASKEPRRFICHTMVSIDDPQLDEQVAWVRLQPGGAAQRIVPIPETGAVARLEKGEFEPLFAAAERHSVPVFCWLPGRGHLLLPYLKKFPHLQFILDHCGVGQAPHRFGPTAPTLLSSLVQMRAERVAQFDEVVELAQYPNLALN
jgi:predicted TIM-barrel fold metal-dependent hydrolase